MINQNNPNTVFLIRPEFSESGSMETLPPSKSITIVCDDNLSNCFSTGIDINNQKVCITSEACLNDIK